MNHTSGRRAARARAARRSRAMVCLLVVASLTAFLAPRVRAQSIEPPIVILTARTTGGELVIANPTLFATSFVLESFSFTTAPNGDLSFQPLDTARIHLDLSAMSGRIPPRQRMRIRYVATADTLPAWFAIVASFSRGAPTPGLTMRMQLVQTVYLMQRSAATATDLEVASFRYDPRTAMATVRIMNNSAKLTRLSELRLVSEAGPYQVIGTGPIFPFSTMEYTARWTLVGRPRTAQAVFADFTLASTVALVAPPAPPRDD